MDFSYNYTNVMQRFVSPGRSICAMPSTDSQDVNGCPVELCFKINRFGGEVPVMAFHDACGLLATIVQSPDPDAYLEVVVPLVADNVVRRCSGADTIMKYLSNRFGRINKVVTPKEEMYYGGNGLVLNKDFDPILYVTKKVVYPRNTADEGITIHVAPNVFTDDVSTLNKSILKKGIAFYLTHKVGSWGEEHMANIVIDNGKSFFRKPAKPTVNSNISEDINALLKDNIAEVLQQIKHDSRSL